MRGPVGLCVSMAVAVAAVILSSAASARANPAAALDKPALTAAPAELLEAARAAPAGDWPYVVLRQEEELSADDQGRITHRSRRVLVVRTPDGSAEWRTLVWLWSAGHEDRPRLRARVVSPGGAAAEIDPKQITDAPVATAPDGAPSDQRRLEARLPALRVGAVLEYEVTATQHQPRLPGGGLVLAGIGDTVPASSVRIELSAPAARKAKIFAHGLPAGARPVYRLDAGRERWSYALSQLPPVPAAEPDVPGDGPSGPYVGLSTAASWRDVARAYRKLTDRRIADGPPALPAELPRAPTLEAVRAITAWVHRKVHATDIDLWQAAAAPRAPAETLQRGHGDAGDKATLLVALLRRIGLRAELALLDAGGGRDTDAELPGVECFDRALVRVRVGGGDVWIDPTEELAAPGRLPSEAQGRRALLAADDTAALVLTPAAAPADNFIRQVRTFELSERGPATRVTEVTRVTGVFEPRWRRFYRDQSADDTRAHLVRYAARYYDGELAQHRVTAPDDLGATFTRTLEIERADVARTSLNQIWIAVHPGAALQALPPPLAEEPDAAAPRRADFLWPDPFVMEIEHRFVLPPGYAPPAIPADTPTPLGTATLTERRRLEGRTLVITLRFDSGKLRLSPAEFATLHREVHAARGRFIRVELDRVAHQLSRAGKHKEAIAEIERLIRLHPAEAIHHQELAHAYLQIGMGIAARRAARRAVGLEPGSAEAHVTLGAVLSADSFARPFGFDFDRAGALAALARARQLDPKYGFAAFEHGDLLSRDASGYQRLTGPDAPRAIEAMRAAYALEATEMGGLALAAALLGSGAQAEAERLLRGMAPSEERDGALVAAVAAGPGGSAAAIRLAGELRTGAARRLILGKAAHAARHARHYDAMRALLAETGITPPTPQMEEVIRRLQRATPRPLGRDPKPLAFEMSMLHFERDRGAAAFWDARTQAELRDSIRRQAGDGPREHMADWVIAASEVAVTGGEAAWRIEVTAFGSPAQLYAALDGGSAKIVGVSVRPAGLARHVLRLVERGDLASAARCLDWLVQDEPLAAAQLGSLWGPGRPRDRDAIALAGAILAGATDPDRALAIATRCASAQPDARAACDRTIAATLEALGRWPELEAHAAAWASRAADPVAAVDARLDALIALGRGEEAERLLGATRAALPDHGGLARRWASLASERRDYAEAVRRWAAVLQRPDATDGDRNNAAWMQLFTGKDLRAALDLARKAVGPDRAAARYSPLHTLASVEAELGDVHAARLDGWQAMDNIGREIPAAPDWYLYGRIAEQLGLRDDAIAAYRRVGGTPRSRDDSHALAQHRLARLGATP